MSEKRIYIVGVHEEGKKVAHRLVRAGTVAQAIRHVAKPMFEAEVASQDRLVELVSHGIKVEDAGEDGGERA